MAEVGCVKTEWPLDFISAVTLTWVYKKCPALLEQLMILIEVELVVRGLNVGGQCQIILLQFSPFSVRAFGSEECRNTNYLALQIIIEHMLEVEFYLEELMDYDSDILNLNLSNCVFDCFVRTPTL